MSVIGKDQLIFDPTEIADSDSVGAYLRSSDGTLLTHTNTTGAVQALDVNLAGSTGGISIVDSDGDELDVQADGSINVNATLDSPVKFRLDGAVVEVIEDSITPANNQPLPVKLTSATGDIQITAGDLNVQLEHTGANFDSLRIGDGTTLAGVSTNTDLKVVDRAATGFATSAISVTNVATQLVSSALTERKEITIQNLDNRAVFLGNASVTISNGIRVPARGSITLKVGSGLDFHAISASGTADIRILELA